MNTILESGFSPLGAALDYDARMEAARAWCEDHAREVKAGGMTLDDAVGALLAGDLYRVDTGSAGFDCIVDAFNANEALSLVARHAGLDLNANELRTKFDPWSAKQIRIGGAN
jgi:hypothetical protein